MLSRCVVLGSSRVAGGNAEDCGAGGKELNVGAEDIVWKNFGVFGEVIMSVAKP